MKKVLIFLVLTLFISSLGCARNLPKGNSWEADNVPAGAMQIMADDASRIIAADYPPGHTQIFVVPAGTKSANHFASYLENAFRNKGFTVLSATASEAINVLYRLDALKNEEAAWYLNIQFAGRSLARVYNLDGPEGILSQTGAPAPRTFAESAREKGSVQAGHFKDGVNDVSNSLTGSDLFD